ISALMPKISIHPPYSRAFASVPPTLQLQSRTTFAFTKADRGSPATHLAGMDKAGSIEIETITILQQPFGRLLQARSQRRLRGPA
ncbi:hypothetical protein, partial [Mesorhizobium sp. M4B.F.Ca.ET.200.01.1.1]|uniref:hypothetical protein n=1 Tax=Mesorhizobium sp. M4B.F.Ca.ET.200.01.1.1 TaxID=2563952 RepID=UPI001AEEDC88